MVTKSEIFTYYNLQHCIYTTYIRNENGNDETASSLLGFSKIDGKSVFQILNFLIQTVLVPTHKQTIFRLLKLASKKLPEDDKHSVGGS